uniref:Uncharacterized protein n=1 Tax=Arundo donax TaxID=35708 RepID=A0A0A9M693_ARUDO
MVVVNTDKEVESYGSKEFLVMMVELVTYSCMEVGDTGKLVVEEHSCLEMVNTGAVVVECCSSTEVVNTCGVVLEI